MASHAVQFVASPVDIADSLTSQEGRPPTPHQCMPPSSFQVRFGGDAIFENDDDETCVSLETMNRRRSRSRRPTPFQPSLPRQADVQFGLTAVVDCDEGVDIVHTLSGTLVEPVTLTSEALAERVETPRASHSQALEDFGDGTEHCVPVDHAAFEDKLPHRLCSATEECAVCQEPFGEEGAKVFPCGHFYHADCILKWLERQLTCPLCRRSFVAELGDTSSSSTSDQLVIAPSVLQRYSTV